MYKKSTLSNGIRVITHNMKQRESIAIGFWIGVGGRYEEDRIRGAAHFLEHIVFKGSQKYNCDEIKTNIEGVGGMLNAFTSEEQTCFYAKIPSQHLKTTFDTLADMVINPKIATKDVLKEKTVIIEEIKMYHDMPQYFVMELLDGLVWPGHPLGKSLAGTIETVTQISGRDLRKFHRQMYTPKNIVVSACGKVDHEEIVALVQRALGKMETMDTIPFEKVTDVQAEPQTCFFKKDIEQMHLAFGMPGYSEIHKDKYALTLLSILLGGNMSSRLFVELREKRGLAYSISCCSKSFHDTGIFMIRAGVDNNKLIDALKLICKELDRFVRNGVKDDEFKRAKDYLLGQLLLGLEDTMDHMLWMGESVIAKDEVKTLKGVVELCKTITKEDIKRVAKDVINKKKYNLAVVGPISARQQAEINALFGLNK